VNQEVQHSLVLRTGMALAAVILLAMVNMLASYLTAESAENDAVRINLAGSLRMQSYRISSKFILHRADPGPNSLAALRLSIKGFETILQQPVLADHIRNSDDQVLGTALARVESDWLNLKGQLLAPDIDQQQLLENVDTFVANIDYMVKKLELQTERKFRILRLIQGSSLLMTVCLATLMFLNVYKYVVGPLHQLVNLAGRLRAGDFSSRLDSKGDDELSLLANTFNDMADSLDTMYRSLEEQVQAKTQHLENAQEALRFLYDTSQRLGAEGNIVDKLARTVDHLQRQIGASRVEIHLSHKSADHPLLISSAGGVQSAHASGDLALAAEVGTHIGQYPLQHDNRDYGLLKVALPTQVKTDREQHQMLAALADTIGAALANEGRKDQEHRVALMEERTAIARELHDSIAQSLSFTKIQISRFQSLQAKSAESAVLDEVLSEIRSGIQAAYGQLRELLTTFRLQLNSAGLQTSLAATTQEFEDKANLSIKLSSTLQNYPLTPNEEIHILQIVREALSNVLRHSDADSASIRLGLVDDMIDVRVIDNGDGFTAPVSGRNHYGQTIMLERAEILGGTVEFLNHSEGGAEVKLRFPPEQSRDPAQAAQSENSVTTVRSAI
jgi:two-component system nitrate/nitrite sensor histidine kinase NarX